MKNYLRIFSIVMATLMLGAFANVAAADSDYDCHGPGMMGGYGWHGMMGGEYGPGYGMGPGMMGGHGYGMMGYGDYRGLNLTSDQQTKITQIHRAMRTKQLALMGEMMDAQDKLQDLYDADKQDAAAINKQYKAVEDLRRQMVDNAVEAHNRIDALLTKEQREQLRDWHRGHGPMMRGYER